MLFKLFKSLGILLGSIFISVFIITLLEYFNILNIKISSILKLLSVYLSIFVSSLYFARNSSKGYQKGLIISIIFIILSLAVSVFNNNTSIYKFIFYIIALFIGLTGGITGITLKRS